MGDTPTGKVVGSVVPVLVMAIATFMILNQLQIAPEIVTITYAALIGGVFLAMALAFGLGGREVAGRMLDDAYDKGQEQRGQVKRDMEIGKERGKQDAERAKVEAESARATARDLDRLGRAGLRAELLMARGATAERHERVTAQRARGRRRRPRASARSSAASTGARRSSAGSSRRHRRAADRDPQRRRRGDRADEDERQRRQGQRRHGRHRRRHPAAAILLRRLLRGRLRRRAHVPLRRPPAGPRRVDHRPDGHASCWRVAGVLLGAKYNVLSQLNLPRIPVDEGS